MEKPDFCTGEQLQAFLVYLDDFSTLGFTNVYSACYYLEKDFGIAKSEAHTLVTYWVKTFSERNPKE